MALLFRKKDDTPRKSLWQRIKDVALADVAVLARGGVDQGSLELLEQTLLESDFGVPVTMRLVDALRHQASRGTIRTQDQFLDALRDGVTEALAAGNSDPQLRFAVDKPTVILVLGVNGAGKTTFIGKLSSRLRAEGKSVLVGAGDTFRAGAIDQLRVWAERTGAEFVGGAPGGDPAAVAWQAIDAGVARGVDVIIIDTAGRLHTSGALMDELKKVQRVVEKRLPGAPHEALLVLDGTGWHTSNALSRPDNVTLLCLPPYAPELNPIKKFWDYLRKNNLSLRIYETYDAIVDACCKAWTDRLAKRQQAHP